MRQAVAEIAAGDRYDHAQVRDHELPRGVEVLLVAKLAAKPQFLVRGEERKAVHGLDVVVQTSDGRGDGQREGLSHIFEPPWDVV